MASPIFTRTRKTRHGFVGIYGVKGIWQRSTGIIRTTQFDALHDAKMEALDLSALNRLWDKPMGSEPQYC